MLPFIFLSIGWDITDLQHLSVSLPQVSPADAAGTAVNAPPKPHISKPGHLLPTYKIHVCHRWEVGVVVCARHEFISGHRPCGHSAARWLRMHGPVCKCMLSSPHMCVYVCVCGDWVCTFLQGHLRQAAPGRALSRPQEGLWEQVWEELPEMCVRARGAVRWICVHHGCIWPRGRDRRSEQRVSTKEQQIQCRVQLTHFWKWSRVCVFQRVCVCV